MKDLIDRQTAYDVLTAYYHHRTEIQHMALHEALNKVPSAQPEERTEKRTDAFALPEIIVLNEYDTIESEDGRTGFGVYVPEEKKIYVAGDVPQEMKLKALFHELAHWVQDVSGIDFDEDTANELSEIIYDAVVPEETHDKRMETHACDCISRQAAIDMLHGYFDGMLETDTWSPCDVYGLIEILPSVDAVEIVRCKDCKHSTEWYRDKRRCFLWCEDGIDVFEDGYCSYWEQRDDEQNDG